MLVYVINECRPKIIAAVDATKGDMHSVLENRRCVLDMTKEQNFILQVLSDFANKRSTDAVQGLDW